MQAGVALNRKCLPLAAPDSLSQAESQAILYFHATGSHPKVCQASGSGAPLHYTAAVNPIVAMRCCRRGESFNIAVQRCMFGLI